MSQPQQKISYFNKKDIDQIDNDVLEEMSVYRNDSIEKQNQKNVENNITDKKVNLKRINFLQAKDLTNIDEDVYDEFHYEQDTSVKTQVSEKVQRKIDKLKLETIENQNDDVYISNVNKQIEMDIEYHKKLAVRSAIDLIDTADKKEQIADDMIQEKDTHLNNASKDFRNAWIVKTVENKYNNGGSLVSIKKDDLILSGNMLKFTGGFMNKWKQVRCELREDYFQVLTQKENNEQNTTQNKYLLTDSLNYKIFQISVQTSIEDNIQELVIKLLYSDYVLRLREAPNSKTSIKQWLDSIQLNITKVQDIQKYKLEQDSMPFVSQSEIIMESEFIEKAKSGDLVLFHTDGIPASMQRKTTSSKYDHVGIVIKLRDNLVRIFDATGDGVCLTEWNKFIYENGQLNYSKREKVLPSLYSFVLQANGKKYGMNIMKFAKMTSVVEDNSIQNKQDTDYFCSELVAKSYKEMGLLNQITSSTQYWPRSFSSEYEDKELILYDNAYLEHEQLILLDTDLIKIKSQKK